jgi:hypothetical protein
MALYIAGAVALLLASLVRDVGWPFFAGMVVAAATWEITKYRLRRNARRLAADHQGR